MPKSSQFAKMAASLATRADVIDEEVARILLALNDVEFACQLFAEAAARGKSVTPEAWKAIRTNTPRSILPASLFDAFVAALRERNDRGAKQLGYFLAKLKPEKDDANRLIAEALGYDNLHVAVWIMRRPTIEINRLVIYRWLKNKSDRALDLANELNRQVDISNDNEGRRTYLDGLAKDLRSIVTDNEELRRLLKEGEPDEIADVIYNCLFMTDESREALERFAWDRPECIPHLADLIQKDAKDVVEDGATKALGGFLRTLAHELTQHAEAAMTAAHIGG